MVVFAAIAAHLDAPGHQGQAAVAVYAVPFHFALKVLRFRRAATRFAAMGASNVVGCAGDAAPSRASKSRCPKSAQKVSVLYP